MNWINFLNQLKENNRIDYHANTDVQMFVWVVGLGVSIHKLTKHQTRQHLGDCFYHSVLLADFFNLQMADIDKNIYGDVAYKFVNHDRIHSNYTNFNGVILEALASKYAIDGAKLQPYFMGLTTAFVDCAWAYGWSPKSVMERYFD